MKWVLFSLILIWVLGFIWLAPQALNGSAFLGRKIDEVKQQAEEGQVAGEKVLAPTQTVVAVTRVVDGDTFQIGDNVSVRIIGVNTPETVDPRRPVQCFGSEAKDFSHRMLDGQRVRLEKDVSETDKYGRLLRYVYIQNADGTETFFNLKLLTEGYAESSSFPPDIKHQQEFKEAQNQAILANKGLWGSCGSIPHGKSTKNKPVGG